MVITRTPFRLSFFGGGTDYPTWYQNNGGLVVAAAFSKYCYISVRKLPPFFDHKTRIVYSQTEAVKTHAEIRHPAIRSCLLYKGVEEGLEIHHDGDLPARSGIGSSSSFTVGFLMALDALQSRMVSKKRLAAEAIHVEQKVAKENVGIQDQIMATYGGMQLIDIPVGGEYTVRPILLASNYKAELESHVMIAFSGLTRIASNTAKSQIQKMEQGQLDSQLNEMMSIAREGLACFEKSASMKSIGSLLQRSWELKRSLSDDVSNEAIDAIYSRAIAAGAYGGRLLGAGGGGFLMFVAPPEMHERIKTALEDLVKVWVPFGFDQEGAKVILCSDD